MPGGCRPPLMKMHIHVHIEIQMERGEEWRVHNGERGSGGYIMERGEEWRVHNGERGRVEGT